MKIPSTQSIFQTVLQNLSTYEIAHHCSPKYISLVLLLLMAIFCPKSTPQAFCRYVDCRASFEETELKTKYSRCHWRNFSNVRKLPISAGIGDHEGIFPQIYDPSPNKCATRPERNKCHFSRTMWLFELIGQRDITKDWYKTTNITKCALGDIKVSRSISCEREVLQVGEVRVRLF